MLSFCNFPGSSAFTDELSIGEEEDGIRMLEGIVGFGGLCNLSSFASLVCFLWAPERRPKKCLTNSEYDLNLDLLAALTKLGSGEKFNLAISLSKSSVLSTIVDGLESTMAVSRKDRTAVDETADPLLRRSWLNCTAITSVSRTKTETMSLMCPIPRCRNGSSAAATE